MAESFAINANVIDVGILPSPTIVLTSSDDCKSCHNSFALQDVPERIQ
jgi:hypothetical protein